MTKEELLIKLRNIEWDDFEVKEAKGELPKNIWDTVSAFANTSGGWIVLGIHEDRKKGKSEYVITGVGNPEKIETKTYPMHGYDQSIDITVPKMAVTIFKRDETKTQHRGLIL